VTVREYFALCPLCRAKLKFDTPPKQAPKCERCGTDMDVKRTGGPAKLVQTKPSEVPLS
jgi:uncharacterized protein (DUF983 family)